MRPDSDALAVQTEWCVLIAALISRYAGSDPREIPDDRQSLAMRRALAYLHDAWNQAIPLERLAQEAGMAPTYFCRQFAKSYGLAPHRYQTVLRIKRAKAMLTAGTAIADVATATGFADQSHLGRHLKACLGVTPGELNRLAPKARTF
jgi:AraC-like DNA-binding protein